MPTRLRLLLIGLPAAYFVGSLANVMLMGKDYGPLPDNCTEVKTIRPGIAPWRPERQVCVGVGGRTLGRKAVSPIEDVR